MLRIRFLNNISELIRKQRNKEQISWFCLKIQILNKIIIPKEAYVYSIHFVWCLNLQGADLTLGDINTRLLRHMRQVCNQ